MRHTLQNKFVFTIVFHFFRITTLDSRWLSVRRLVIPMSRNGGFSTWIHSSNHVVIYSTSFDHLQLIITKSALNPLTVYRNDVREVCNRNFHPHLPPPPIPPPPTPPPIPPPPTPSTHTTPPTPSTHTTPTDSLPPYHPTYSLHPYHPHRQPAPIPSGQVPPVWLSIVNSFSTSGYRFQIANSHF